MLHSKKFPKLCDFMASVGFFEVFLALFCFLFLYCLRKNDGPPRSFPIVGMMPELLLNVHRIHDWCTEILETCHCTFLFKGPWFANMNMLVTCDPANIHHIMSSNFANFPKGSEFKQMFDILGDSIINSDMDLWRNQRTAAQGFIRHHRFRNFSSTTSQYKVEEGLIPVMDHFVKQGMVVDLEDVFQRFTFDATCILVTGHDPRCLSVEFPKVLFSKALDDAEEAIFYRHVRPQCFIKLQRWLNMGQERKYRKAWQVLDDVIAEYICQKREDLNYHGSASEIVEEGADLLTSYITGENSTGFECDDKFLRDTILTMMLAGRDTTSSALTWFIWLVSCHPRVENKIIEELRSKIPAEETKKRQLFKAAEVKDLVYLHGAICEALRLYPPVPFQHKKPLKPDVLPSGHPVHPNMKILFNLYSMGRMKSIWGEDCFEFKPERWINERGGIKHEPSYKFLSFNAGPRTCLGKDVAFVHMKSVASAIVYNYRVHVSNEIPIVPAVSIILHTKDGLMAKISSRWD
ncbi:cytochrome P450, family 96, subfamily A, polypeptide 10 [Hibiscus trionum]|uniref:Cytochrome P450, family 96, subfamily A, polypeptide 10 n=1 Tax=Hibiscus trionum TaxID=183268 RepID=A0A9W7LVQ7_HIBTR|nr:cytochrome P450, family 96, subfamily A, polypeptide 10 [Hibiscus trionum]